MSCTVLGEDALMHHVTDCGWIDVNSRQLSLAGRLLSCLAPATLSTAKKAKCPVLSGPVAICGAGSRLDISRRPWELFWVSKCQVSPIHLYLFLEVIERKVFQFPSSRNKVAAMYAARVTVCLRQKHTRERLFLDPDLKLQIRCTKRARILMLKGGKLSSPRTESH